MRSYTMVFVFDEELKHVLLLKKAKPPWQKDLYNGPGGKIEDDETANHCAVRELFEETQIQLKNIPTYALTFECVCDLSVHQVYVYGERSTIEIMMAARGTEAEPLVIFELDHLQNNQKILAGDCWHLICITKTRLEQGNDELRVARNGK